MCLAYKACVGNTGDCVSKILPLDYEQSVYASFYHKGKISVTSTVTEKLLLTRPQRYSYSRLCRPVHHLCSRTSLVPFYRASVISMRFLRRAQRILKDNIQTSHSLFTLLPSGKRYRSNCCRTTRQGSFFLEAVRVLNSSSTLHHVK